MNIKTDVNNHVNSFLAGVDVVKQEATYSALQILLNGHYEKYNIDKKPVRYISHQKDVQSVLFNLNERTNIRKKNGVFYTPKDVARYIVWNSVIMQINQKNNRIYREFSAMKYIKKQDAQIINKYLFQSTVIDPTCGTGEFLLCTLIIKINILKAINPQFSDDDIVKICKTLHGNDIDDFSTDIAKIRLFIEFIRCLKNQETYNKIAKILFKQFNNKDFVNYKNDITIKYDFVIGNPPYVEYRQMSNKQQLKGYGNIYADVIHNSFDILKNNGVLGYIIPLSYVSTERMHRIRDFVYENTDREFILSFADRPDCLFDGAHQKLNILIARKSRNEHSLFTSNYKHWYKEERDKILKGYELKHNTHNTHLFIPKIGNNIEERIYRKVHTSTDNNIFDRQDKNGKSLFLNMRACFWVKAFSYHINSSEYKEFKFAEQDWAFVHCLLNSSLYWLYWTIVSDCWHITQKELKGFLLPKITQHEIEKFMPLSTRLENELERTKKYIGSKQAEYEYKHKECKKTIDLIDEQLAMYYDLSSNEINYIKNFALKYRLGSGANESN